MYRTTVRRAKERLDAQGFGLNNFEKIFNDEMVQAVDYSSFCIIYREIMMKRTRIMKFGLRKMFH